LIGNDEAKQGGTTWPLTFSNVKAASLPKLSVMAMSKVHSPFSPARVELIYIRFVDDEVFCFCKLGVFAYQPNTAASHNIFKK